MKKEQTAIEYLMTYGWAILIILIVAGTLAYYGIFSPEGFIPPAESRTNVCENLDEHFGIDMECNYEGFGDCECYYSQDCIEIEDYKVCERKENPDLILDISRSD